MRKYKAKISYTMDKDHPDKDYVVGGWKEDKRYEFEDAYTFADMYDNVDEKELYSRIKHDLMLVAGGGYNTDHIHDVVFEIL